MTAFGGAARLHKRQFEAFVDGSGTDVSVRQPAAKVTGVSAADKVLGTKTVVLGVGDVQIVTAIWNADITMGSNVPGYNIPDTIAALGRADKLDAVLRLKLADALTNPDDKFGRTTFDTAADVVYGNYRWIVTGTARTGLAPVGPYILWVAVKKAGEP